MLVGVSLSQRGSMPGQSLMGDCECEMDPGWSWSDVLDSVVALTKDNLMQVFVEVERLPLGEAAMVLCQEELSSAVADALAIVARPGFVRSNSTLPGLPSGWILFSDVQVLGALPEVRPDGSDWGFDLELNVLQPLSTSQLVVEGGLRFPGQLRRWSSLAPPEIRVSAEGSIQIAIEVRQVRSFAQDAGPFERFIDSSAAVLGLEDLMLPDGDYEIVASRLEAESSKPEVIDQVRLRLRSADEINPAPLRQPHLERDLSAPSLATLTASIFEGDGWFMRGAAVRLVGTEASSPPLLPQATVGTPPWWHERALPRSEHGARSGQVTVPAALSDDCFRTGRHVIVLPTFYGKATSSSFQGQCRQCGVTKRYPSQFRARSTATRRERPSYVAPTFDTATIASVSRRAIEADVGLDALSHDRAGNERAFEQLALQVEPSQLFVDRFLRGLESLGHLEVRRDLRTLAPVSWEVTPAALAQTGEGTYVLTGFRSRCLFDALSLAATRFDVSIDRRKQAAGPDRVRLKDCSISDIADVARQVLDATGIGLAIVPECALAVALLLPPLSTVTEALPRQAMVGYRSANRWDENKPDGLSATMHGWPVPTNCLEPRASTASPRHRRHRRGHYAQRRCTSRQACGIVSGRIAAPGL